MPRGAGHSPSLEGLGRRLDRCWWGLISVQRGLERAVKSDRWQPGAAHPHAHRALGMTRNLNQQVLARTMHSRATHFTGRVWTGLILPRAEAGASELWSTLLALLFSGALGLAAAGEGLRWPFRGCLKEPLICKCRELESVALNPPASRAPISGSSHCRALLHLQLNAPSLQGTSALLTRAGAPWGPLQGGQGAPQLPCTDSPLSPQGLET